jgi:hypothetical protein
MLDSSEENKADIEINLGGTPDKKIYLGGMADICRRIYTVR